MELTNDVAGVLDTTLRRHADALCEALRKVLVERTFPAHPMHRGKPPPRLDEADALRGVHVIYTHGDFVPIACGLSTAGAWKCGARRLLEVKSGLFGDLDDDVLDGISVVQAHLVERWVRDAWLEVRHVAPDLRGYVSEHDGGEITDLDTGEQFIFMRDVGLDSL